MRRNQTPPWKRRKAKQRKPVTKPVDTTPIQVVVASVGHQGDGIAALDPEKFNGATQAFIPNTLPDEEVIITPKAHTKFGIDAELGEVITPSPHRQKAQCQVADHCGGCQTQIMADQFYQDWKFEAVKNILAPLDIPEESWRQTFTVKEKSRRRARLAYRHTASGIICGFRERKSHQIIAPQGCVILNESLMTCVEALQHDILPALSVKSLGEVTITDTDQGWDITLHPEAMPSHDEIAGMINGASERPVARLSLAEKDGLVTPHFTKRAPKLTWSHEDGKTLTLFPAPGSFLQVDSEAEKVMQSDILHSLKGYEKVLDLFCGSGTLSLPLLMQDKLPTLIHGYDSGDDALEAMQASAKAADAYHRVNVTRQNLFKDPITTDEINRYDAVIVDPPRAGASTLMPALADSNVRRIMMVSCNPQTFTRDASVLCEGGYECSHIRMIDQFLKTPHAELVAQFDRT